MSTIPRRNNFLQSILPRKWAFKRDLEKVMDLMVQLGTEEALTLAAEWRKEHPEGSTYECHLWLNSEPTVMVVQLRARNRFLCTDWGPMIAVWDELFKIACTRTYGRMIE